MDWEWKMRVGLISATALAAFAFASAASAQTTTGTVNVVGTVGEKCTVTSGDTSTTFSDTFDALDLANTNGTLRTIAPFSTASTGGWRVHCTSIPDVSISATPMVNVAPAPSGYANRVNYIAYADFDVVTGSNEIISTPTGGSSAPTALGSHLQNVTDNVVIRADTFTTPNVGDILVSGSYSGAITVTVTP
jgi:hypothetical protein